MSSSGLIYAVIVGAWAAYLVPMWLRRQDELNEARPTERFSTAIRLLSGRAAMERRYAKDLQARSAGPDEPLVDPDGFTGSVDVRALAVPSTLQEPRPARPADAAGAERKAKGRRSGQEAKGRRSEQKAAARPGDRAPRPPSARGTTAGWGTAAARQAPRPSVSARYEPEGKPARYEPEGTAPQPGAENGAPTGSGSDSGSGAPQSPPVRRAPARRAAAAEAAARARRSKVLARRRRTTVLLFAAFTLGTVVAAVGGLAFLWAPGVPAVLLSAYIVYLRAQERRRFTYTMDRRRAEAAAQRLRERQPHRRPGTAASAASDTDDRGGTDDPAPAAGTELSALAAGRRALVEQTDHAEWVDQQRERRRGPGHGDSWDPVPVPLPTYVTAPVAPRAGGDIDLGAPDTWSSARSSAAEPPARDPGARGRDGAAASGAQDAHHTAGNGRQGKGRPAAGAGEPTAGSAGSAGSADDDQGDAEGERSDARRAASARRARERGRTPLFDQYADGDRPRAAGQ